MGALLSSSRTPAPVEPPAPPPEPEIPPPPEPPPPPPCFACLNYHVHDHPSVVTEGANFQRHIYPNESVREKFEGIVISETPEWFGKLTFRSGAVYEGGFRSGEFNGFGHYVVVGRYEYLGGFNEGKKEGFGREITADASGAREEYVGGWKDDKRHGEAWINGRDYVRYYMGTKIPAVPQMIF
jgi:hypothetical protein